MKKRKTLQISRNEELKNELTESVEQIDTVRDSNSGQNQVQQAKRQKWKKTKLNTQAKIENQASDSAPRENLLLRSPISKAESMPMLESV